MTERWNYGEFEEIHEALASDKLRRWCRDMDEHFALMEERLRALAHAAGDLCGAISRGKDVHARQGDRGNGTGCPQFVATMKALERIT